MIGRAGFFCLVPESLKHLPWQLAMKQKPAVVVSVVVIVLVVSAVIVVVVVTVMVAIFVVVTVGSQTDHCNDTRHFTCNNV